MSLFRPFWKSIARKLGRHGGLVGEDTQKKMAERLSRLEKFRFKAEARTGGLVKAKPGSCDSSEPRSESEERQILEAAWQLRNEKRNLEGINHLEQALVGSREPEVIRMFQACLAYEKRWDNDAIRFLKEALALVKPKRDTLIWGPIAIISNSHWSRAMNAIGRKSQSFMWDYARINRKDDFDLYVVDIVPEWLPKKDSEHPLEELGSLPSFLAWLHVIRNASVVHIPMTGQFLGFLRIWREEAPLLREAGIKVVAMPYGGDYYCYSRVQDPCVRYGLLANYPELALKERETQEKVEYWQREADCVLAGYMVDAMGRWDVTTFNYFHIDTDQWQSRGDASKFDGRNGPVKVLHTPNHRGFKGSEFLVAVVDRLKVKGLQVELVLLEKVPNERVRELMQECDILAEQFIATAYAFSGIEGMASGLPVMANLDDEYYTRVYRRYSFLNECPIFSTTPETLEQNLEILVTNPGLRAELGRAGREYVEKYHSFPAAQYLFGKIYDRILEGKEVDLIRLYHPFTSEFAKSHPPIEHPLFENRLPEQSSYQN